MAAEPRPYRFTIDEFEQMGLAGVFTRDVRVELIEGEIIEMSPINVSHAMCVDNLTEALILLLNRKYRVTTQNPVQLPPNTMPQPDLAIVERRKYVRHPEPADIRVVIEVADSSLLFDRNRKFPRYAAAGIAEAWLVDVNAGIVERHTEPGADGYGIVTPFRRDETVASTVVPGLAVPVAEIFG